MFERGVGTWGGEEECFFDEKIVCFSLYSLSLGRV